MKVLPTKSKVYEMMAQEQVHHEIGKQEHLDVQESSMAHRGKKRNLYEAKFKNSAY